MAFNDSLPSFSIIIILIADLLSSVAIIFNFTIIIFLINYGKFTKHSAKTNSRRIAVLHSINTYTHLIGILSTLLIMCIRTLYGDLFIKNRNEITISWQCQLLAYSMYFFAGGVYGSCFLQALFRFCRIILPNQNLFQNLSFNISVILTHWMLLMMFLLPVFRRSIYIPSDNFCLAPFDDRWTAAYISLITAILPAIGIFILYIKIVIYMKYHLQSRKQWRRMKREVLIIRRILLLVIIILQTSSAGIILWILTFFDKRLHPIFYRLLRFLIILCMIICSIALAIVSPQLKRAIRLNKRKRNTVVQKQTTSSNNMEEIIPLETLSVS